jgi:predicted dithiol-disulfide oxidoreductase (DUF899 family)
METLATEVKHPKVVLQAEWLVARKEFLKKEKEFTRLRDELSRQRRELPWEKVEKDYVFDGPGGKETLADLFHGRSQLIIYHFMFGPGWAAGCPSCSYLADHFDGPAIHLANRDVTLAVVSRAPIAEIEAFKKRMGWKFHWASSYGSDFNYDYHVSFTPDDLASGKVLYNYQITQSPLEDLHGTSVFFKDETGTVFHTYSTYARGGEWGLGAYRFLDLTPKGRNETGPNHTLTDWVRHHDRYDADGFVDPTGRWVPAQGTASCCKSQKE